MNAREIDWSKAPEGATHFGPENEEWIAAWYKLDEGEWFAMLTSDDDKWDYSPYVDDERVSQMIQRPAEWSGIGMPPVGTVCKMKRRAYLYWETVEILCLGERRVFYRMSDGSEETRLYREVEFRTPEQIAAEERVKAVAEMMTHVAHATPYDCDLLYRAGYRKVEGDKQ